MANKAAELLIQIKTVGEEALGKLSEGFKEIGKEALVAFGEIAAVVVESLVKYREHEEATNALTRAMVNSGIYSKELKDSYLEQAEALAKVSLYDKDAITSAQTALQTHLREIPVTKELTQAVLDLAAKKKIDLASAADLVGRTITTSTNALARQSIEMSSSTDKHVRFAEVIQQVNMHMGGQASAAAEGLGVWIQLRTEVDELFKAFGERLAPAFTLIGGWLKSLAQDTSTTSAVMDLFVGVVHFIADTAIRAAGEISFLAINIGGVLATAFEAVSAAAHGNFSQAIEITKNGMTAINNEVISRDELTKKQLSDLDESFNNKKKDALNKEEDDLKESLIRKGQVLQLAADEESAKKIDRDITDQQLAMSQLTLDEGAKVAAIIAWNDKKIAQAGNAHEKERLLRQKYSLIEKEEDIKIKEFKKASDAADLAKKSEVLNQIATLSSSHNQTLAVAGKAAAITQIAIATPVAISKALEAFPPPFNFIAAGLVGVAMAEQAANIAGVPLAEGGIVMPTPGGTQATIGEGGQAEAVIPLDRAGEMGFGGGGSSVTIINYGGMLGSESDAHEFAKAVDRELLKLRQNNESVSFDSRVV